MDKRRIVKFRVFLISCLLFTLNLPNVIWYENVKIHSAPFVYLYDRIQEQTTQNVRLNYDPDVDTSNNFTLWHRNSLTAYQINQILAEYGSPAINTGNLFVEAGLRTTIDNAYVLYIFIHESTAGTNTNWAGYKADGSTTHNVGNIICTPDWQGNCYGRFRDYASWHEGINAAFDLLAYYRDTLGMQTIDEAISLWAPPIENDTDGYINGLKKTITSWRQEKPSFRFGKHKITETMEVSAPFDMVNCAYWGNQPNCQHWGTDYPAPKNSPVYMPFDCWYITTGTYPDTTNMLGDYVMCTLEDGKELYLGHLTNAIRLDSNSIIRAGDKIGEIYIDHTHVQLRDTNRELLDFDAYYRGK